VRALTLVRIRSKDLRKTIESVGKVQGVETAFLVFGRFDAVAVLSGRDAEAIKATVLKIHGLEGVRKTETLMQV